MSPGDEDDDPPSEPCSSAAVLRANAPCDCIDAEPLPESTALRPRIVPNGAIMLSSDNASIRSRGTSGSSGAISILSSLFGGSPRLRQRLTSLEILELVDTADTVVPPIDQRTAKAAGVNVTFRDDDPSGKSRKSKHAQSQRHIRRINSSVIAPVANGYHSALDYWHTHRFLQLLPVIALGVAIWTLPPASGLSAPGMHLLAVFACIFFSLITTDYEVTVVVALALTVLSFSHSFACRTHDGRVVECAKCTAPAAPYLCDGDQNALKIALSGFGAEANWLIFAALQLGRAIELNRLGTRISLHIFRFFGRSILGLGYAVCVAELLLGPFIPSTTARGGGILMPIVTSTIARTLHSHPNHHAQVETFLAICASHGNLISASLYLTGAPPNLLVQTRAKLIGLPFGWLDWFKGAVVPSLVCVLLLPPLVMKVTHEDGRDRTGLAEMQWKLEDELENLGPMSPNEWTLVMIALGCASLWLATPWTEFNMTSVALGGLVALLFTNVLTWKDVLENQMAWTVFFWLGGYLVIADQLSELGVSTWIGHIIAGPLHPLAPIPATLVLSVMYFMFTLAFATLSTHPLAFAGLFMAAGRDLQCPRQLLMALLAYFTALATCMNNFSTGVLGIYQRQGRVNRRSWLISGALVAFLHIGVYFTAGMLWWKVLGWY